MGKILFANRIIFEVWIYILIAKIRKVYKVEAVDDGKKILAFKKITYTKDNEGVILFE